MQVFLPVPDFRQSLEILDGPRLRKQRLEAKQLIDTIFQRPMANGEPRIGWINHPAAVMFRRYTGSLIHYYNLSLKVNAERGGNNLKLIPECEQRPPIAKPWWLGIEEIHSSHRARLIMKGKMDLVGERIRKFTGARSANKWLKSYGFPTLNECRMPDHDKIQEFLDALGAEPITDPNYYDQFGWTEDPTMEYRWPGETEADGIKVLR